MTVDVYCSRPHYAKHLAPIWHALGGRRGRFYVTGGLADYGDDEGLPGWTPVSGRIFDNPNLTLVAGYPDEAILPSRRRVVYLEHGAGQTYSGWRLGPRLERVDLGVAPWYSGGAGHERVALFLCPSEAVADRWRARYPAADAVAVGVPKLDGLHRLRDRRGRPVGARKTVAFTFHHDNPLVPETRSWWPTHRAMLADAVRLLQAEGWRVLGHGHPGLWGTIGPWWTELGVPFTVSLEQVIAEADVLVADNTSALPEAGSCGVRLVWLNDDGYRRDVEHGGRFWVWPEGQVQVCPARAEQVVFAVDQAWDDPPEVRAAREAMVRAVYVAVDGRATERAVAAINQLDKL